MNAYQRMKEVFSQATRSEVNQGISWYHDAKVYHEQLAEHFNLPVEKIVGITSALSPRTRWKKNISDTYHFIKAKGKFRVTTYFNQKQKALRILKLKKVTSEKILDILHGPKTCTFFQTILFPDTINRPVIDRHIIRCYLNKPNADTSDLRRVFHSPALLEEISQAIEKLANEKGIKASHCQAIIWSTWKRLTENSVNSNGLPIWDSLLNEVTEQQSLNL